jgi:hypothetical protein
MIVGILYANPGNMAVYPACCLESLLRSTGTTVNRRIDAPHGGTFMQALQSHSVLILRPYALARHPQPLVHRLEDSLSLLGIGMGILAKDLGYASCELISSIVIGRTMGNGTTTII